jgi:hypothetical protein
MSLSLPGFTPPDSPKDDSRAFATPGGMIELVLKKNVPLDEPMPNYEVLISTEYGREVLFQVKVGTGHIFTERDKDEKTKRFVLKVGPPEVLFAPTTYTVRAMVNGTEVYFKTVTVQNHPALP